MARVAEVDVQPFLEDFEVILRLPLDTFQEIFSGSTKSVLQVT
jgi:hypothetical protein